MTWFRVDNRLIHGQVIEAWLPYTKAHRIIVVNEGLKNNLEQQLIISLAVPEKVELLFCGVAEFARIWKKFERDTLVLFANCLDAYLTFEAGVHFETLNVANLHYGPGKKQLCMHIALDEKEERFLTYLKEHNVKLDFRCVPGEAIALSL